MLKLQNINRTNGYIEAHYLPENSSEVGYLKLNCQTKQIVDSKITMVSKPCDNCVKAIAQKRRERRFFEVDIDESNIFSESIDDVIGRFERIERLADEGKLDPPGGVANYYSFPKKKE